MHLDRKSSGFALGLLLLGLGAGPAIAATPTASFGVSASVEATCLATVSSIPVGAYAGSTKNGSSTVLVTCTNPSSYNIGLSTSLADGTSLSPVKVAGRDSDLVNYVQVSNSGEVVVRNELPGTATASAATGTGPRQMLSVRGPTWEEITPAFAHTITVTIIY